MEAITLNKTIQMYTSKTKENVCNNLFDISDIIIYKVCNAKNITDFQVFYILLVHNPRDRYPTTQVQ
jgi:hypothetical protein